MEGNTKKVTKVAVQKIDLIKKERVGQPKSSEDAHTTMQEQPF